MVQPMVSKCSVELIASSFADLACTIYLRKSFNETFKIIEKTEVTYIIFWVGRKYLLCDCTNLPITLLEQLGKKFAVSFG